MHVIRWDAESNDNTLAWYTPSGFGNYFPGSAQYNYRKPTARVYAPELGTTPAWDNGQIFGGSVNTQDIVDQEIAYAKGKIDGWLFDAYPPSSFFVSTPSDEPRNSEIMRGFEAYMNSALRPAAGLKFAFILFYSWYNYLSGAYKTAWNTYLNTLLADPLYQKVNTTQRVVVLWSDWATHNTDWVALKTAVGGAIFGISVNSVTTFSNLGLQGNMVYGPNSSLPSSAGQDPWTAQATRDQGTWGVLPGGQKVTSCTPVQDRRPIGTTRYVDIPSRPQFKTEMDSAVAAASNKYIPIYAHSEITEGGDPFDAGVYDVCLWSRGGYKPQSYTYELDCHSAATAGTNNAIILTGTWTYQQGSQGSFHNDYMKTSTAGASCKLNNHDRLKSFDVIGATAAGLGTMTINIDGVASGTVNFAGATAVHQTLFSHTFSDNPPIAHTVELVCDGTGEVRPDSFSITYKP